MAVTLTITEEIRLDHLARQIYGDERSGGVELLLDANPQLASYNGVAPAGFELLAPELPPRVIAPVSPWS